MRRDRKYHQHKYVCFLPPSGDCNYVCEPCKSAEGRSGRGGWTGPVSQTVLTREAVAAPNNDVHWTFFSPGAVNVLVSYFCARPATRHLELQCLTCSVSQKKQTAGKRAFNNLTDILPATLWKTWLLHCRFKVWGLPNFSAPDLGLSR